MATIADRMMLARVSAKLSQPQLARIIGTSHQWVNKVENGEIRNPAIEKMERVARATHTTLGYFYDEEVELELDLASLRRMERIARYVAPEWLDTLEEVLKEIRALPPGAQLDVWQQIKFTVRLKKLELKEQTDGRKIRRLEIQETREPYEEQP